MHIFATGLVLSMIPSVTKHMFNTMLRAKQPMQSVTVI